MTQSSGSCFIKGLKYLLFLVLGFLTYVWYLDTFDPAWNHYYKSSGYDIIDLRFYGSNKEFVLVKLQEFGNPDQGYQVSISQNRLFNVTFTDRVDARADFDKIEPKEQVMVKSYDLSDDSLRLIEEFDLIPILKKHGITGQVYNVWTVDYQGEDYVQFHYRLNEDITPYELYDPRTDSILDMPDDFYQYSSLGGALGRTDAISHINDTFNLFTSSRSINRSYTKSKDLSGTNLYLEEPELAKAFEEGYALYVRPDRISDEDYFNKVIHWFAPAGQEVLELYAKDRETEEKTLITSYADYLEWAKNHPEEVKPR